MSSLIQEIVRPNFVTRILNSKEDLLSGALSTDIRQLLEHIPVLIFPKLALSEEEQIAFTKTLGEFVTDSTDGIESVSKITFDDNDSDSNRYLKGTLHWHMDGTIDSSSLDTPFFASLLQCIVPSFKGTGNTSFANCYAAWDSLTESDKKKYVNLEVMHAVGWAIRTLPLAWPRTSGRTNLVLGSSAKSVIGCSREESMSILQELHNYATSDQFTYSHEWETGDLVIWDNTGTLHRAEHYDPKCGRLMHRTKIAGSEPWD